MDGKRIVSSYVPFKVNNPYAENIMAFLKNNNIETYPIKKSFSSISLFRETKIFNINWFESIEKKGLRGVLEYYVKKCLLVLLKLTNKKIIYTLHNRVPHHSENRKYSQQLMRWLATNADSIVIMSEDSRKVIDDLIPGNKGNLPNKVTKIPHPSYVRNYNLNKTGDLRTSLNIRREDTVFMFIGSISSYKNIELLIEVFVEMNNPKSKLIIAGKPSNLEYGERLKELIGTDTRIIPMFDYISHDDMELFYNTADIVVLPYDKTSSLNSGALYLSFTFSKTVICPDIGSVNDIADKSILYQYGYNTDKEHKVKLFKCMQEVCKRNEESPYYLVKQGKQAFEYLMENHNDKLISDHYGKLYTNLTLD